VAVEDEAAQHVAVGRTLARLQVHEVARSQGTPPPCRELRPSGQAEAEPVPGGVEQAVEPVEDRAPAILRREEAFVGYAAGIPAQDDDPVALRPADALPGRFGDPAEHGGLVGAGRERERHPVA
jgi:hypothetical protein